MNDMLLYELDSLQTDYRTLLSYSIENMDKHNTSAVLDEICVFWQKNRRLVNCALNYITGPYHSYLFTGATIFGIEDNEQYPFLCLGDFHIWDDPIYSYIKTAQHSPNKEFNDQLKSQVWETIKDNIKLIDALKGKVYILPVRMLSISNTDQIHELATKAFLSIFKEKISLKDFQRNFKTIDEIIPALDENTSRMLIFDADTNPQLTLKELFLHYRNTADLPLPIGASDAAIFLFGIYGNFSQVISILSVCMQYKLVPYIRYPVCFKYLLMFAGNFQDHSEISQLLFPCVIAHTLYQCFDIKTYAQIPISNMCAALHSRNFERRLFELLASSQISLHTPDPQKAAEIINQELARCLSNEIQIT